MSAPARDRAMLGVAAVWLIVAAVLTALSWPNIAAGTTADGDDYMRLLEVRDWLAGQSWWDVTQHRMNPPIGGLMHWSRLLDLPLALGIGTLTPLLGQRAAEAVTMTAVPLLTLGVLMWAVARAARRLFPAPAAPVIAAMLVAATGYVTVQMSPTRIDHHGWQIVAAAVTLAALLDPRPLRSGAIAGAALALWLNISIEGLPFAVAAAAAVALRWTMAPAAEAPRFAGLLAALALGSVAAFVATHPVSGWATPWCDAVAPVHLLVFAVAGGGALLLARIGEAWPWQARLGALASLGAACGLLFLTVAPACAASPFSRLDPLVHDVWYLHVLEGLPVWRQTPIAAFNLLFFPVVGLAGCAAAWRAAPDAQARRDWLTVTLLLAGSLALAMLLRRAGGVAHVMAVPGALAIIEPLRARVGRLASPVARALGAFAAVCLPSPLTPIYASALLPEAAPAAAEHGEPAASACDARCSFAAVAALPPAEFLTTIDLAPGLLALTHHSVLAGAYHRNDKPIGDLIRAFTGDPDAAHAIVLRHHIGYVMIPPQSNEAAVYRSLAPRGLMADLSAGHPPAWLQPVPLGPNQFKLWRVVG